MADRSLAYAENAPGPYYVERRCTDCDKCRQLAPAHFAAHPSGYAIVSSQPASEDEWEICRRALAACPVAAIGDDGLAPRPPAPRRLLPDLWHCGHPSPRTDGADSYVIVRPGGNVLVDTPAFDSELVRFLEGLGDLRTLFLTHRDAIGEAEDFILHFGLEVLIHESEAAEVPIGVVRTFREDFDLTEDLRILTTPGHSAGSSCLLWRRHGGCLFTGDHLVCEAGSFGPVPYVGTADWARQRGEAERLLHTDWRFALPGRGSLSLTRGYPPNPRRLLAEALTDSNLEDSRA
ncbi:MAG TPA: ferredoxin [Oscillatoriaceae cyanobacterium]